MRTHFCRVWGYVVFCLLLSIPSLHAQTRGVDWNVAVLDKILASTAPGQKLVQIGDMFILVSKLQDWRDELNGTPTPSLAFDGIAPLWTSGNVYYTFDANVSAAHRKEFLDGASEWATFANIRFIARTTQANYVTIMENPSLSGGQSTVGMVGGQQFLEIGPNAWNRPTICHELGHTLGLIHEHQRSDRDSFVTVLTNNIIPGAEGNFVKLSNSQNQNAYDFLSVMHYDRNSFSINPATLNTLVPLPAFSQFLNIMGSQADPVLSASDRTGVAMKYGAGPTISAVVTNTFDSGPGSLRTALYYAFDHPGTTITFNIPPSDPGLSNNVFNIQLTDQLPSLVRVTTIDGTTQPSNPNPNGPAILLNGALAPPPSVFPSGIRLKGTNCTVRALIINGFAANGILIDGTNATGNLVKGCYLGLNRSGTSAVTNGFNPILIADGATGNIIGGTNSSDRNIISGSAVQGLLIRDPGTSSNLVQGNYIGLNATGTAALSNTWAGIEIANGASSNIIGGSLTAHRNIISGNGLQGILITSSNAFGNVIEGNFIGLSPSGTTALSNGWSGINLFNGPKATTIRGNVISGNGNQGISIQTAGTDNNLVLGNFIGLSVTGNSALPNGWAGIEISGGSRSNIVGGSSSELRNIISGNTLQGILLANTNTSGNFIAGNYIGVNFSGSAAVPNGWAGIEMFGGVQGTIIGGTTPGAGNVISGNLNQGIVFGSPGTAGNLIQANKIGLDATGFFSIPNGFSGIEIYDGGVTNVIGGSINARNYISGNANYGIAINGPGTFANMIQGNTIGLNLTNGNAPNTFGGVAFYNGTRSNQVGGLTIGSANFVAANSSDGIQIFDTTTTNNTIRGNSIFGNSGIGMGLYSGGNRLAAAPTLTNAVLTTNIAISGSLTSTPSTTFHLDFYASPVPLVGLAQARNYLGFRDVTTSAGGSVSITATFSGLVPVGQIITATATDLAGNTSSLSSGIEVTATDNVGDGIPNAWRSANFGGAGATTNNQSCATCDPDLDGMNNHQEFLAGTNPMNTASNLRFTSITNIGPDITVQFLSTTGTVYRIEVRNNLNLDGWLTLADQILGTGSTIAITNSGASLLPSGFYRATVLP